MVSQAASVTAIPLAEISDMDALACQWRALEQQSDASVFLSWQWIGVWLEAYKPNALLLKLEGQNGILGLGLVVISEQRRHVVLSSRCLRLHQTGVPSQDQIWIEYNGFLALAGHQDQVDRAFIAFVCDQLPQWDEFMVGAIDQAQAERYGQLSGLHSHLRWEAPCYGVDLAELNEGDAEYLETLSKNTRHQIRRSERLYREQGAIELVRPDSAAEALVFFDQIGPLHLAKWEHQPGASGFTNPDFVQFHRKMIERSWGSGGVDLVQLRVGGETIVTFYNLLYRKVVYFYLSGIRPETDNRLKPGLLAHSLCIEDYRSRQFEYYDFMGGEERYKSNLGRRRQQLVQVALQKERLKFKLERVARRARRLISS
ncbi:MAG: GNAT family N-acetyltransferase [Pseudomonadales bacterium]|nr:GNAT family N-acetyltransferase [Pseudomonadales bacterium]